jgi:glycosyltransferase involved in cell wall biosynthesis
MASGVPVLTSNTSSLGEIAGDAAETVDPTSTDAIADAIRRLATDPELRRERSERGLLRARSFSWTQTAREMLAVYHRAAGVTVAPPARVPSESPDQRLPVKSMSRSKLS